jgi:hypothetical protein
MDKLNIFISYSSRDSRYLDELRVHLKQLERVKPIRIWYDAEITPGQSWDNQILKELDKADIIIFLVSASFLASDYVYEVEMKKALEKAEKNEVRIIPIILTECLWQESPLAKFQVLPVDGKAVYSSRRKDSDEAWYQVVDKLRYLLPEIEENKTIIVGNKNVIIGDIKSGGNIIIGDKYIEPDNVSKFSINEVFPLSGVPKITFVEPVDFKRLISSIKHVGRGLVIEGPSGIGKTTALKRAIGKLNLGAKDFTYLSARNPNHIESISNLPRAHKGIVAIDDFHRLEETQKKQVSDYLKYLADTETENKKLIVIGIPNTGNKLISFGYDLAGRIDVFELVKVKNDKIEELISKGEKALNVKFAKKSEYISAANGSLNIAQFICHYSAINQDIFETVYQPILIETNFSDIIQIVKNVLRPKFEDFVFSFTQLGGIKDRTCIRLLHEIALSENGSIILNRLIETRPELSNGIGKLKRDKLIESIVETNSKNKSFIYYDKTTTEVVIDDPQLIFYLNYTSEAQLAELVGKTQEVIKGKIFVSYSHKDKEYLDRIMVHLKPLIRDEDIDIWVDTRIRPGQKWNKEIQKALESAKIAILIVSADFIASDYITEKELPTLIKSSHDDGTIIIPLFLKPANLNRFINITQYQGVNTPDNLIIEMSESEKEKIFVKLSQEIEKYYRIEHGA